MVRKVLLGCGIASSLLYIVMNVVAAMRNPGYDSFSQTVSELSAIGAPTRDLWVPAGMLYEILVIAFGIGVWMSAGRRRPLQVFAGLLIAYGIFNFWWPPMHQREVIAAGVARSRINCISSGPASPCCSCFCYCVRGGCVRQTVSALFHRDDSGPDVLRCAHLSLR